MRGWSENEQNVPAKRRWQKFRERKARYKKASEEAHIGKDIKHNINHHVDRLELMTSDELRDQFKLQQNADADIPEPIPNAYSEPSEMVIDTARSSIHKSIYLRKYRKWTEWNPNDSAHYGYTERHGIFGELDERIFIPKGKFIDLVPKNAKKTSDNCDKINVPHYTLANALCRQTATSSNVTHAVDMKADQIIHSVRTKPYQRHNKCNKKYKRGSRMYQATKS